MLDRVSVSIALTTIMAVLAKVGLLYREANESWFTDTVDQDVLYVVLIAAFLMFFRGKMMHDDSAFFRDLEGKRFKEDPHSKARIKSGLMVGYLSWLCWGPVIYFLDRPTPLAWWLLVSLGLSTAWLVVDILTRRAPDEDTEAKKRPWWVLANVVYAVPLLLMAHAVVPPVAAAALLVVILTVDWLGSDALGGVTP